MMAERMRRVFGVQVAFVVAEIANVKVIIMGANNNTKTHKSST